MELEPGTCDILTTGRDIEPVQENDILAGLMGKMADRLLLYPHAGVVAVMNSMLKVTPEEMDALQQVIADVQAGRERRRLSGR